MTKLLIIFVVSFVATNLFYWAYSVAKSLYRIANALEDLVYDKEEDEEESEVAK